jgi:cell division protein FtsQ
MKRDAQHSPHSNLEDFEDIAISPSPAAVSARSIPPAAQESSRAAKRAESSSKASKAPASKAPASKAPASKAPASKASATESARKPSARKSPNKLASHGAPPVPNSDADLDANVTRGVLATRPKRFAWVPPLLAVCVVLGLGGGLLYILRDYVRTSPRFAISEIRVSGSKRHSNEEILALAGLRKGDNIFLTDLEKAKLKLLEDPWITDVAAARTLPNFVQIEVFERKAAAMVSFGETYLATREGKLFKKLGPSDDLDLPIISGLDTTDITDDRSNVEYLVRAGIDLAFEYSASDLAGRYPLEQVVLHKDGSFEIVAGRTSMLLNLGRPPFRKKIEQATRVIRDAERRGSQVGTLLFDTEGKQDRVVARFR